MAYEALHNQHIAWLEELRMTLRKNYDICNAIIVFIGLLKANTWDRWLSSAGYVGMSEHLR